jgi:hypothetical protein
MPTGMINIVASVAGLSIQASRTRTASGQISHEVTIPAAKTGTLTTRTGDDEGVFTLAAGHGLAVDDITDVYWTGGIRYGMKVTAVNGNEGTAGGVGGPGAGDALPTQDTPVTASKQVTVDTDFDGDKLEMIVMANTAQANTKRAHFDFQDSGGINLHAWGGVSWYAMARDNALYQTGCSGCSSWVFVGHKAAHVTSGAMYPLLTYDSRRLKCLLPKESEAANRGNRARRRTTPSSTRGSTSSNCAARAERAPAARCGARTSSRSRTLPVWIAAGSTCWASTAP